MASRARKFQAYHQYFLDWWLEYPRRIAKKKAAEAYDDAIRFLIEVEGMPRLAARLKLLESAKLFAKSDTARDKQFCPHPATWLNQARYDDDPEEWNHSNSEPTPEPLDIAGALERTRKDGDDGRNS